jgi:hypothetical protein
VNVFAISYYAPPQLTPQAIQVGRQLYHLDARVSLLHGRDPQFADGYDQYPDFFERVIPLAVPDPGPPLTGVLHRAAMRALPLYGACPDLFGPWRRKARARALFEVSARRPDVLASFGMPMSDHLLALDLKRRTGLPWLAHFSDPWADNPFHETGWLEHQVNAALEKRVMAAADQIVFTSQRTLELVMARYPQAWRAKAAVLSHAWDMAHFDRPIHASPLKPGGRRHVVRHIGACYGARSPQPLFAALARIHGRTPRALDHVAFELVGHVSPGFLESPDFKALPPGLLTLPGKVGYRESLHPACAASALLVIDAPSATESVFLPSKLVEYIGTRRPVWGITPPGTSAELITEWAGSAAACAAPGDIEAVARMLLAGLGSLDASPVFSGADAIAARFAPGQVSGALRQHLRSAVARCAAPGSALVRVNS